MDAIAGPHLAQRVEHRLPMAPQAARAGRRAARHAARGLLDPEAAAELELLISEVVTNAVRHGGGEQLRLVLTPMRDALRVEVTDEGGGFAPGPGARPAEDGGYGLMLVERLARRWGMTREGQRTRVWFEIPMAG